MCREEKRKCIGGEKMVHPMGEKSVFCEEKENVSAFRKDKFMYVFFKNNLLGLQRMRIRSLYTTVWVLHQVKKQL